MLKGLLILLALIVAGSISLQAFNAVPTSNSSETAEVFSDMEPARMTIKHDDSPRPPYSKSGHDVAPLSPERIRELARNLTEEEARIILRSGTEAPFCGTLLDNKKEGVYICRLCSLPLFSSDAKFNSGTGWPSFFQPVDTHHIRYETDDDFGMVRTEILCARCNGHLGHVFDDGPQPTGRRYCLNSASLTFFEKGKEMPEASRPVESETAYFAAGCFWGVEDRFEHMPGVIDAISGYQGGKVENPTYEQVCGGKTGHAETVKVVFDPKRITYRELLEEFFKLHDPTQVNRQGPDIGSQYRSAIFANDEKQLAEAKKFIEKQQKGRYSDHRIATQVVPVEEAGPFWEAEESHQDYNVRHGTSCGLR